MSRVLGARVVLMIVGIAVWGYGERARHEKVTMAGIGILAVCLLLRFAPKRWNGKQDG